MISNRKTIKTSLKKDGMFAGANHLMFSLAKELRNNMTDAENALWLHLKKGIEGYKFRRQHPIGIYIVDFYCHKLKLAVEVDGTVHDLPEVKEYDLERQKHLEKIGISVVRFTNLQVINNPETVLEQLNSLTTKLTINTPL